MILLRKDLSIRFIVFINTKKAAAHHEQQPEYDVIYGLQCFHTKNPLFAAGSATFSIRVFLPYVIPA